MERRLIDDDGREPRRTPDPNPTDGDAHEPEDDPDDGPEVAEGADASSSGFVRGRTPRCPRCRYDLTGTLHAGGIRCPECGHDLDPGIMQVTRERRFFNRMGLWVAVLSVLGILGTITVLVVAPEKALFVVPLFVFGAAWIPFLILARGTSDMVE